MLPLYYIYWHYSRGQKGVVNITRNLIWFIWHFFSIGILLATFFSPWERIQEQRKKGLDITNFFETSLINIVMRLVGVIVRSTFIITGILFILLMVVVGVIAYIIWLLLPVLVVLLVILGAILIIKSPMQ
jgi:tellurite resistance protein TehA-like permease